MVTPGDRLCGRLVDLDFREGMVLELTGADVHGGDGDPRPASEPPRRMRLPLGTILSLET